MFWELKTALRAFSGVLRVVPQHPELPAAGQRHLDLRHDAPRQPAQPAGLRVLRVHHEPAELRAHRVVDVTESARAHSYFSI